MGNRTGIAMPVEDSRLSGFFRLSVEERREIVRKLASLDDTQALAWASTGELSEDSADRMIENVIGTMSLPVGVATNFIIDGKEYIIPFCIEESSVVAAASNIAKRCRSTGGFYSNSDEPIMIGQIQILEIDDFDDAIESINQAKQELLDKCNSLPSRMIALGGGCKDIITRVIETKIGKMLIVHLHVDCRDAMGANAVNTMSELIAPDLEELTKGRVALKILSNLADLRLSRITAKFPPEEMVKSGNREEGLLVIDRIIEAFHFAVSDPYRAATHNKGIMNAISPVGIACGQDWRAIEAGCHAYAAIKSENYTSMSDWYKDEDGNLVGKIELPMAVGTVGGASKVHPAARANLALLGVQSATELGNIMAAAGLAQNLGAMRALATEGIQQGHMKLHARNMAVSAGAEGDEIEIVATKLRNFDGPRTQSLAEKILADLRNHS
ncbi:MAG: hydroxymethylglutaryl-CoA reductase, degradative [Candidatus Poseidoniaceae archaeon]